MKKKIIISLAIGTLLLMSCEHKMTFETNVHEDGSLDKTISFEKESSTIVTNNIVGIDSTKGWSVVVTELPSEEKPKDGELPKKEYKVEFKKRFDSVDKMNEELNAPTDTTFKIKSTFEKKFRWFYTYLIYTETYLPVNRFKLTSPDDFLNKEDYEFIDQLTPEGKPLTKADSLYLHLLHVKTGDYFANMAIYTEENEILKELIKRSNLGKNWLDTLVRNREYIYDHIDKMKGEHDFALRMADSLHIPLDRTRAKQDAMELSKDLNSRVDFMGFANNGKFTNIINMPWSVVNTNADSIVGNTVIWRPLVTKFLFKEYPMYAESRKLNMWALLTSIGIVLLTVFIWQRSKRS